MILDIIIFLSYLLFATISVFGYGLIFTNYFIKDNKDNIGLIGILGFFILFSISIFIHFFINLSQFLNFILLLTGFIIGILNIKLFQNIKEFKFHFIAISVIFVLSAFSSITYADYEWYHLPYVNYLNNFKIIFGLVNISNNYAYGHGWLDILGMFNLPIIGTKGLTALPIIFYFYFIIFFLHEYYKSKIIYLKIISIFIILVSILIFNRLKDFGADIQPTFTLFILIFFIIKFFLYNNDKNILKFIILFFFYSCILRIGSIIILPVFLIFFTLNIKSYYQEILFKNIKLYIFLILFFILFLSKNFITTGCFFYPIPFTCFDNNSIVWASPSENVKERYEFLSAISKRWQFYSIKEGGLENRYQYYDQILNKTIMSPAEYNSKKIFWIKYFLYDHDYKRFINIFILILIFSSAIFYISKKNNNNNFYNNQARLGIKLILLGIFLSILFWFFSSPQMRYGGYSVISSFFIIISAGYLGNYNIESKKLSNFSNIFLSIALIFFAFKNVNSSISDLINNRFTNFPWPNISNKIENVDYYSKNYNNIKINFITKNDNSNPGSPRICGNLSMPCLSAGREICISELNTKNKYIFIKNNNKQCLQQFKENYWQH